ncbi:MAG: hypothetical protein ACRYGR_03120 [Janthinobacterium lividum]
MIIKKLSTIYLIFNLLTLCSCILNATEQYSEEKSSFLQNNQKILEQSSSLLTYRKTKKILEQDSDSQKSKLEWIIEPKIEAHEVQIQTSPTIHIMRSIITNTIDSVASYFTSSSLSQNQLKFHPLEDLMTKAMTLSDDEIEYSLRTLAKDKTFQKDKWDIIYKQTSKNIHAAYLWAYIHEQNISKVHNGFISFYHAYREATKYYTRIYEKMKKQNNQAGANKADQGLARVTKLLNSSYDSIGYKYSKSSFIPQITSSAPKYFLSYSLNSDSENSLSSSLISRQSDFLEPLDLAKKELNELIDSIKTRFISAVNEPNNPSNIDLKNSLALDLISKDIDASLCSSSNLSDKLNKIKSSFERLLEEIRERHKNNNPQFSDSELSQEPFALMIEEMDNKIKKIFDQIREEIRDAKNSSESKN